MSLTDERRALELGAAIYARFTPSDHEKYARLLAAFGIATDDQLETVPANGQLALVSLAYGDDRVREGVLEVLALHRPAATMPATPMAPSWAREAAASDHRGAEATAVPA